MDREKIIQDHITYLLLQQREIKDKDKEKSRRDSIQRLLNYAKLFNWGGEDESN